MKTSATANSKVLDGENLAETPKEAETREQLIQQNNLIFRPECQANLLKLLHSVLNYPFQGLFTLWIFNGHQISANQSRGSGSDAKSVMVHKGSSENCQ